MMRTRHFALAAATIALSVQAADALALTCYEIIDKNQNVTFRAAQPPFAMDGEEWTRQQDRLRSNNLHLRWHFTNDCSPTIVPIGEAGELPKSDQIFDPNVVLRATAEYMTGSGRPTGNIPARRR